MANKRRKVYRSKKHRYYYGRNAITGQRLFWRVWVSHAKQAVKMPSSLLQAMMGLPGESVGCHLSNCGWENKKLFPHPVVGYPSFNRTSCMVPDETNDDGSVRHVVLYDHSYGELVDLNDKDKEKMYIKEHPELAERELTLRVPAKRSGGHNPGGAPHGKPTDPIPERAHKIPRGSLRRAIAAGLVPPVLKNALLDE